MIGEMSAYLVGRWRGVWGMIDARHERTQDDFVLVCAISV